VLVLGGNQGAPVALLVVEESPRLPEHEVTAGDYAACVAAGACTGDSVRAEGLHCTYGDPDLSEHPVSGVTWRGAHDYCVGALAKRGSRRWSG